MRQPSISVVIPVFNGSKRLPQLLDCLSELSPQPSEFVFVDDGSSDQSFCILQNAKIGETPVRALTQSNRGPAAARNRGILDALGDYVAFTDDDCLPDPGWIGAFQLALAKTPNLGVAFGRIEMTGKRSYLSHFVENHGEGHQTANALYSRTAMLEAGCFDERFRSPYLEDTDLYLRVRLNHSEVYIPEALIVHPARPTTMLAKVRRIAIYRNDFLLFEKHPEVYRHRHRGMGPLGYLAYYLGFKHFMALLWKNKRLLLTDPRQFAQLALTLLLERFLLIFYLFKWVVREKLNH